MCEQQSETDHAVGCMRRAELEFDQRCTQLQTLHHDKCLMLYTRLNTEPQPETAEVAPLLEVNSYGT